MKRKLPAPVKWFLYILTFLFAVVLASILALQTRPAKNYIDNMIEGRVSAAINGTLVIGRIKGFLLTGLHAESVTLGDEKGPFAALKDLRVTYSLRSLVKGSPVVTSVRIDGLDVNIDQRPGGRWNVDELFKTKTRPGRPPQAKFALAINNISIANGRVRIKPLNARPLKVENLGLKGGISIASGAGSSAIALTVRDLSANSKDTDVTITSLDVDASLINGTLAVSVFDLATKGSVIRASGTIENIRQPVFNIVLDAPTTAAGELRTFIPSFPFSGNFSASLRVLGPSTALTLVNDIRYAGATMHNELRGDAAVPRIAFQSTLNDVSPRAVFIACGREGGPRCPEGIFNAVLHGSIEGASFDALRAEAAMELLPSSFNGAEILRGGFSLKFERKELALNGFSIETPSGALALSAKGYAGGLFTDGEHADITAELTVRELDPAAFWSRSSLSGAINAAAALRIYKQANQPLQQAAIEAELKIEPSRVLNLTVHPSLVTARWQNGTLAVEDGALVTDAGRISFAGTLGPDGDIAASCNAAVSDISFLTVFTGTGVVAGSFNAKGAVKGKGGAMRLEGRAESKDIVINDYSAGRIKLEADITLGKRPLGSARLEVSSSNLAGHSFKTILLAILRPGDTAYITADVTKDDARSFRVSAAAVEKERAWSITAPAFIVSIATTVWMNDRPLELYISSSAVTLRPFALTAGEQKIESSGSIFPGRSASFTLRATSVDIASLGKIPENPLPVSGRFSCTARADGPLAAPSFNGTLRWEGGALSSFTFDMATASFRSSGGSLSIDAAFIKNGRGLVMMRGALPFRNARNVPPAPLDITAEFAGLDLAPAAIFVNGLTEVSGALRGTLSVKGSLSRPLAYGRLHIIDAALGIAATGTTYRQINGVIVFNGESAAIERFAVKSGEGSAALSGEIAFERLSPVSSDLAFTAARFTLVKNAGMNIDITGTLLLKGPAGSNDLTGSIIVNKASIAIPSGGAAVSETDVVFTDASERLPEKKGPPRLIDRLAARVTVEVPGNAWITGAGANAEIEGKATLRRERGGALFLNGEARTLRGTFAIGESVLKITEGRIRFTGGEISSAYLDVRADEKIDDVTVTALVAGTVKQPELRLKSDPAMDESDILSYLVFGRPAQRLSKAEGNFLEGATLDILAGIAKKELKGALGEELSPDVLRVEPTGGIIGIGKYITEKLFVTYEWRTGADESPQTIFDYRLSDYFDLQSQLGNPKTSGIDLFWNFGY